MTRPKDATIPTRNIRFWSRADLVHGVWSVSGGTRSGWTACGKWFLPPEVDVQDTNHHAYVDDPATCLWCVADARRYE